MSAALPVMNSSAALPAASLPASPTPPAPLSERDVARFVVLLKEGLLSENEFGSLTGIAPQDLPSLLADPTALAEIHRASTELRNTGALARLEALSHARGAVKIAADMMNDPEMGAGVRLGAATYIAKIAGTERAAAETSGKPQQVRININFGSKEQPQSVVVEGTTESHAQSDE